MVNKQETKSEKAILIDEYDRRFPKVEPIDGVPQPQFKSEDDKREAVALLRKINPPAPDTTGWSKEEIEAHNDKCREANRDFYRKSGGNTVGRFIR